MNTINPTISEEQLLSLLNIVNQNVNKIYKETHSRSQYLTFRLGKGASTFFKFMRSPQVKVINMIMFWAIFVASWIMTAFASGSILAFVAFGLIIAVYTDLTATAVSSIIKDTIFNYYTGALKNV